MNGGALSLVYLVGVLAIAVSALAAQRVSASLVVRSLLAWLLIIAVVGAVVLNRDAIARFAISLGLISPEPDRVSGPTAMRDNHGQTDLHFT